MARLGQKSHTRTVAGKGGSAMKRTIKAGSKPKPTKSATRSTTRKK